MDTSTWIREGAPFQALPCKEDGTWFNVFSSSTGERVGEVRFYPHHVEVIVADAALDKKELEGACRIFRKTHETVIWMRAQNEAARPFVRYDDDLPYPSEGKWSDEEPNQTGVLRVPAPVAPVAPARKARPHRGGPQAAFFKICEGVGQDPAAPEIYALATRLTGREIQSRAQLQPHEWGRLGTEVELQYSAVAGGAR